MKSAIILIVACLFVACSNTPNSAPANTSNTAATPEKQVLSVVDRPQRIKDLMAARGDQDTASPVLKIVEPRSDAVLGGSTVKVKLDLAGELKGYKPGMDESTHTGNHIHVILDNQPYEAYYDLDQPFELRNVSDGEHTLRIFPSRPWHEAYKNTGAFQLVRFTVKDGGGDTNTPTTTNTGNMMANANTARTQEGKEMKSSVAGAVDPTKPLLTYSRPKGEYKGDDSQNIMIDFWLANAKLTGDGGEYRVRYTVDKDEAKFIDKWAPIWLAGWTAGKHTITLALVDKDGKAVDNGEYNTTTREITITK